MSTLTPRQVRALWADDLESGRHKQGRGYLVGPNGWCCMGRLQDLAMDHGIVERRPLSRETHPDFAVVQWAGLRTESGHYARPDKPAKTNARCLTDLNDDGETFATIAAIIRSEPPGLVTGDTEWETRQ